MDWCMKNRCDYVEENKDREVKNMNCRAKIYNQCYEEGKASTGGDK